MIIQHPVPRVSHASIALQGAVKVVVVVVLVDVVVVLVLVLVTCEHPASARKIYGFQMGEPSIEILKSG